MPEAGPSLLRRHTFADASRLPPFSSPSRASATRPRHSLPAHLQSPTRSSSSHRSNPQVAIDGVALSEEDQRAIMEAGLDYVLRQKAATSGFQLDVVRQGFRAVRRLSLLDAWLKRMSDTVADAARAVTAELVEEAERSGYYDGEISDGSHSDWSQGQNLSRPWFEGMSKQSNVYRPPEDSRAAGILRAEAERSRLSDERASSSSSRRNDDRRESGIEVQPVVPPPPPQRTVDPRTSAGLRIRERLRRNRN